VLPRVTVGPKGLPPEKSVPPVPDGLYLPCPPDCSAAGLRMQALAAAHWQAIQAAECAAGAAGVQPCSINCCSTAVLLPSLCPQLVVSSLMALLRQRIDSLPMVSHGNRGMPMLLRHALLRHKLPLVAPARLACSHPVPLLLWLPVFRREARRHL
jgi:hypothetical protein